MADEVSVRNELTEAKPGTPLESHLIANCDVDQFCENMKIFQSPNVTLFVGPEKVSFQIPKLLLCKNSPFFDRAFNGGFKEGEENTIHLEEDSVIAVKMMIQWMYMGSITLATTTDQITAERLTTYLEFFKLADKIDLQGPLTLVTKQVRAELGDSRLSLDVGHYTQTRSNNEWLPSTLEVTWANSKGHGKDPLRDDVILAEHIRSAFELRSGHEMTKLLIDACVMSYILSFPECRRYTFKFEEELCTIEGFAHALLEAVARAVSSSMSHGDYRVHPRDPLTRVAVAY